MKVSIVYVYPNFGNPGWLELATRFIHSYHAHPTNVEHETIIVCNGNAPDGETEYLFSSLPNVRFIHHDNSGFDIGAFQRAAHECASDLAVFFGVSAYIKCVGWLERVVESFQARGDTLYGTMGNRGVIPIGVQPHIRTTGFWISPALFRKYPYKVATPEQRYPFEHGPHCLTSWIRSRGKIPWVVAYDGEYPMEQWDSVPNGYHQGNQTNLLTGDRMTAPPFYPIP